MIEVEVIENFTLKDFNKIKNLKRYNLENNKNGWLYEKDTFECTEDMAKYLTGKNILNKKVVQIIEVIPEAKIEKKSTLLTQEKKSKKKKK